jgi:Transposase IS116/IS110/IS902 family
VAGVELADVVVGLAVDRVGRRVPHQNLLAGARLAHASSGTFVRLLRPYAEIGDDRTRFHDRKGLKAYTRAYAGAAPITRASGKTTTVLHRRVKNTRLTAAGYTWAFAALTASPGARAHYDRRRHTGDRHAAAQRNLFARLLGCLHHCLTTAQHYDEHIAFPPTHTLEA